MSEVYRRNESRAGTIGGENRDGKLARLRGIRGTQGELLPLLPSGPGGVRSLLLHGARSLTPLMLACGVIAALAIDRMQGAGSVWRRMQAIRDADTCEEARPIRPPVPRYSRL